MLSGHSRRRRRLSSPKPIHRDRFFAALKRAKTRVRAIETTADDDLDTAPLLQSMEKAKRRLTANRREVGGQNNLRKRR